MRLREPAPGQDPLFFINERHAACDPLHFPLLFPRGKSLASAMVAFKFSCSLIKLCMHAGEQGWHTRIPLNGAEGFEHGALLRHTQKRSCLITGKCTADEDARGGNRVSIMDFAKHRIQHRPVSYVVSWPLPGACTGRPL